MIARCARCQGTFTTDRFGRQTCPHCGSELLLADPSAPPPAGGPEQGAPPQPPATPQPPPSAGGTPPPPPPPAGGYGPPGGAVPPAGWGPPPGGGWGPPGGGWGGPPGGGWGGPPGGPPPGPELPSPFAERATRGFLPSFLETWKLVATQPQDFFRRVRIDQTRTAILFGVLASLVGTVVNALYSFLFAQQVRDVLSNLPGEARYVDQLGELSTGRGTIAQILLTPILTVVLMYVGAAILHVLLMLFRGARRPFDATLTVVAYANGLNLLLVVPGCGGLIALVWALVVLVIGLGESQRCGSGKAAAAVFAPVILLCACCCAAAGLGVPGFLKAVEEATKQGKTVNL
ncbi:MAG TPA: YIP1 family protein [Anaeromyxobacter sp.]|nr:YIP1 family protein [Anaeromyxobacter sp.]